MWVQIDSEIKTLSNVIQNISNNDLFVESTNNKNTNCIADPVHIISSSSCLSMAVDNILSNCTRAFGIQDSSTFDELHGH